MAEKNNPSPISSDDGPFTYTYIAVMEVPGIRMENLEQERHLFSFPELNATVMLAQSWNSIRHHFDRSNAILMLLPTAFRGRSRFRRLSSLINNIYCKLFGLKSAFERNLAHEERKIRMSRKKEQKSPGCYLIYKATGDLLGPPKLDAARKIGTIGFGFDIINGREYRSTHKAALNGVSTALSLIIDTGTGSPETNFIKDIIYLKGKHNLTLYSGKIEGCVIDIVTSKPPNSDELNKLTHYIPPIVTDHKLEVAVSLFVQSQRTDGDNLRAYIAAWSALELLVNRLAKVIRSDWEDLLQNAQLPDWNRNLSDVAPKEYYIKDRFYSVACTLDLPAAQEDCEKFRQANDSRSGYYHRGDVQEKDLPTNDVQALFRKYLGLGIEYKRHKRSA